MSESTTDQSSREQEREAFEAWYRRTLPKQLAYDLVSEWLSLDEDGRYDGDIQTAWEGWQARATLPPIAITAEEAGREGEGWLPIETAPKDGTGILLGLNDEEIGGFVGQGRWHEEDHDGPDNMGHDAGFMDDQFDFFRCPRSFGAEQYRTKGLQPTHWQPLPPSPAQSGGQGNG